MQTGRQHFDEALARLEAIPCWAFLAGDLVTVGWLHAENGKSQTTDVVCEAYAIRCEELIALAKQWATRCDAKKVMDL